MIPKISENLGLNRNLVGQKDLRYNQGTFFFCFFKICLVLLANSLGVLAQPFISRTLSIEQGLPEYYVSGIVQDKAGFIWVATRDGLARYDGREFKVFRHRPFNNRSLANNAILSLKSVSDTSLMLITENGSFQLFNPVSEQFGDLLTPQAQEKNRLKLFGAILIDNQRQLWESAGNANCSFESTIEQI